MHINNNYAGEDFQSFCGTMHIPHAFKYIPIIIIMLKINYLGPIYVATQSSLKNDVSMNFYG